MDMTLFHGDIVSSNRILYTPSQFARTNLMYLQEIGELQANKPHISKREGLNSFLFFEVLSGSGFLQYENTEYPLVVGDCVFIDCRKGYSHKTESDLWKLRWIHFCGINMNGIYEKYRERGGKPYFKTKEFVEFDRVWKCVFEKANSSDYIRDMRINEQLNMLLTLLMKESWHPEAIHNSISKKQDMLPIKQYLEENYMQKITLDELAERFFINKYYLTRRYKEQFGISIVNYLLQVRITHAKQRLRFTEDKIEAIGLECGFGAVHYFSRIFKNIEGISPREYREKW